MNRFVYADNAATTPMSESVFEAMKPFLTEFYGNPSSLYRIGREARRAVTEARMKVARALNAKDPSEIIFTGGGSQADNLAIRGYVKGRSARGKKHIITSKIEHHAVLYTCEALEKEGYPVTYLDVDAQGHVDLEQLKSVITDQTALVTIMAANNEIGTIQNLKAISEIAHAHGAVFHTDAVQAVGHMPLDVQEMGIDMLSLSAHKFRGPKGIGALYVRKGIALEPLVYGGGQERGLASGTENVAGMVGLGQAIEDATGEHLTEKM
ncbi:MAG: aminotransferase class V-fold PLP-dependent enzyme, partial [Butyricicoccus pullicaecorum]|nr:aminotransferase class V-fold PLP-dependent enzyme [Butyricicoccus pullicaecorum]